MSRDTPMAEQSDTVDVATVLSPALRESVLRGLRSDQKVLPPALFYDAEGAALFERICELPEYYPTRTELGILRRHAADLARQAGPRVALVEYGSGAGTKVRHLLDALVDPVAYVPVDVSAEQLMEVAAERSLQYPDLQIAPVIADYTRPFTLPDLTGAARRVAFFPGSTIGNFEPSAAVPFLQSVRRMVGDDGGLILGVDRRKDPAVLHAAYNDSAGVTAEFNLNMLARLNRELDANFELDRFRHVAFFNDTASRIEMHLESTVAQSVEVADMEVRFAAGETIRTEFSYKYDEARLGRLVEAAGFSIRALYSDEREYFWEAWLTPSRSS